MRQSELAAAAAGGGRVHPVAFNTASGMRSAECNNAQHGVCRSRDGRLWFATVKGLAMADPTRIEMNPMPPTVVVEEVLVGRRAGRDPAAACGLPPGQERPRVSLHGVQLLQPRRPCASATGSKDSSRAGSRRGRAAPPTTRTSRPGRYRFRVMACNEDGVWNETGASASDPARAALLPDDVVPLARESWPSLLAASSGTGCACGGSRRASGSAARSPRRS